MEAGSTTSLPPPRTGRRPLPLPSLDSLPPPFSCLPPSLLPLPSSLLPLPPSLPCPPLARHNPRLTTHHGMSAEYGRSLCQEWCMGLLVHIHLGRRPSKRRRPRGRNFRNYSLKTGSVRSGFVCISIGLECRKKRRKEKENKKKEWFGKCRRKFARQEGTSKSLFFFIVLNCYSSLFLI